MRYIKLYESFEDIDRICQEYNIKNYTINQDKTIDVYGEVNLSRQGLIELPLNFNKVDGYFLIQINKLTSLEGCPNHVSGMFSCRGNRIRSLKYGPKTVSGRYWCSDNELRDVYWFPEYFNNDMEIGIRGNPVEEIINIVSVYRMYKFIKWLNEYNVIKGSTIFEEGLNQAYYMATKE